MLHFRKIEIPEENLKLVEENTNVFVNDEEIGKGTLYVTTKELVWINNITQKGFSFGYFQILLPNISQDKEAHEQCLNIMVDIDINLLERVFTEVKITPDNAENLNNLFQVVCECHASFNFMDT
ncbi:uncharacterized protein LOC141533947 [Cotesia typhae]